MKKLVLAKIDEVLVDIKKELEFIESKRENARCFEQFIDSCSKTNAFKAGAAAIAALRIEIDNLKEPSPWLPIEEVLAGINYGKYVDLLIKVRIDKREWLFREVKCNRINGKWYSEVCSLYIDDIYNYAEEIEVVAYMPEPTPESYP